jgi:branched-chain amino acid transport system permease protein
MILIGGVGTLSGALVGAATYKLLQFYLDRYFGENATFVLGLVYIVIVMFVPYGIVGTWRQRSFQIERGRDRLVRLLTGARGNRGEST